MQSLNTKDQLHERHLNLGDTCNIISRHALRHLERHFV